MIKAILFDCDGVLTIDKMGSQAILNYISRTINIPLDILKTAYYQYNKKLLYGELTHRDMWAEFCASVGYDIDYSILIDSFRNTPMDYRMISLVKELKANYKIGMITDNKTDRIEEILSHFGLKSLFDVVSISAEYKSGKEERLIFDKTIEKLEVAPYQCIFTDNAAKNLVVPQRMGMQTILFDDEKRDVEAFKKKLYEVIAAC